MSRCREVAEALLAEGTELAPELAEHAAGCAPCGDALAEQAAYLELVGRARTALRDVALTPQAWMRVRAGVDAHRLSPARSLKAWLAWAAVASLVGAGAAVLTMTANPPPQPRPEASTPTASAPAGPSEADPQAPGVEAAPEPGAPAEPALQAPEAVAAGPRAGDVLASDDSERVVEAFGRHELTLAPGTALRLTRWSPEAVVLELERGSVRADVARRAPDEVFEVRAGEASVRVVGTIFRVTRTPEGSAEVAVEHGAVTVAGPTGEAQRVAAGETRRVPLSEAMAAGDEHFEQELEAAEEALRAAKARRGKGRKKVIVRNFEAHQDPPGDGPALTAAVRDRLAGVVRTIQAGSCDQAIGKLRGLAGQLKRSTPAEVYYLMGWCYRKLEREAASAFFAKYRATATKRRWRLPRSAEELPPVPGVGALYR